MAETSSRLTRSDWLEAALAALDQAGLDAIEVLRLARSPGVSRGSFYWHFRNRRELLENILSYWEKRHTDEVIERASASQTEPSMILRSLMENVLRTRHGRYDATTRAWSRYDSSVAAVSRRVDRRGLRYITGLFREMGFDADETDARGRLNLSRRGSHRAGEGIADPSCASSNVAPSYTDGSRDSAACRTSCRRRSGMHSRLRSS
jgi:AcrR family transcriptional regulator